ncbi:MAG: hypothetical protein V4689_09620 [Verrucomicrobiota bacterium]
MNTHETIPATAAFENVDGVEPTTPSMEGEPIAKSEPHSANDSTQYQPIVTQEPPKGDIFDDLAALGRTMDELTPSEKVLTVLPVRKPKKDEWVRCHPEIAAPIHIYESGETRDTYLIVPAALEPFAGVARYVRMTLTVNYSGEVFVWPVPLPTDRRAHAAHVSANAAARVATSSWTRIVWKGSEYEVTRRRDNSKEPFWPQEIPNASDMLRFACKSGGVEVIDSSDHPVARELMGLA